MRQANRPEDFQGGWGIMRVTAWAHHDIERIEKGFRCKECGRVVEGRAEFAFTDCTLSARPVVVLQALPTSIKTEPEAAVA